jgi:hypothetical protein
LVLMLELKEEEAVVVRLRLALGVEPMEVLVERWLLVVGRSSCMGRTHHRRHLGFLLRDG